MRFYKMNGAGNDFIIISNIEENVPEEDLSELAKRVCDRHFSVGADGLMVVEEAKAGGDFRMIFYNSDGSIGEMCGNGARCIARYGFETGLSGGKETIVIEAGAGKVIGERIDRREYRVRLNDPSHIELVKPLKVLLPDAGAVSADVSYILLGDPGLPHVVTRYGGQIREYCGADSLSEAPGDRLRMVGRALRYHEELPKGANVNFFEIISPDEAEAITYERGVEDFTLACGTGAGSITIAQTLMGNVSGRDVLIHMPGGTLSVSIEEFSAAPEPCAAPEPSARGIFLTGPADIAAIGELF